MINTATAPSKDILSEFLEKKPEIRFTQTWVFTAPVRMINVRLLNRICLLVLNARSQRQKAPLVLCEKKYITAAVLGTVT